MKDKKKDSFKSRIPKSENHDPHSETRIPKSAFRIQNSGILYMISTPIGNLEDITLRALNVLKSVDLIAAESMKHSRGLCWHYDIKTRVISYNQHNQKVKGPEIIRRLKSGWDVAYITNAGTPGVSDPGALLVHRATIQNIKVSPIPGPSAVTAALSVSGMAGDRFLFLGFLSNRPGKRRKELKGLATESRPMIFFEAPHRLQAMLMDLKEIFGDREAVLLRELTKVYEEIKKGAVSSILKELESETIKGEITLVVAGKLEVARENSLDIRTLREIENLLSMNRLSTRDIAAKISLEKGFSFRDVYKECLAIKRGIKGSIKANDS